MNISELVDDLQKYNSTVINELYILQYYETEVKQLRLFLS